MVADVFELYMLCECDPGKGNLRWFGLPDGQWEVSDTPSEASPRNLPKSPCINFVRDVMPEKNWLTFVAQRSEAWLDAAAHYFAGRSGLATGDRRLDIQRPRRNARARELAIDCEEGNLDVLYNATFLKWVYVLSQNFCAKIQSHFPV